MRNIFKSVFIALIILQATSQLTAQKNNALQVSLPETEGVSSQGIIDFINAAEKSNTEFHSFMILRHGKVISKGWWNPYSASLKHTMYSCSKSFTATAVGFALNEKRFSIDDKVISFFPNELPDTVSNFLSMLTVRDVLSMTDGQDPDPTGSVVSRDSNWVKSFLALPIVYKPGTKFLYNSLGTYMLSAIVQKVTGEKIIDYLTPRLFEPLGITGIDWETDPKGINTGGWGLRLKTEDMAKFGQLFLQKGKWRGKQILPAAWVNEASTLKIVQHPEYSQARRDSSDWEQGYCYQMWRCRNNAYRGDGAFGQFIIVMPEEDAVIAITAETPNMQDEINLVWQHLLPAMHTGKLPLNNVAATKLQRKLATLALPFPVKKNMLSPKLTNRTYLLQPNGQHIKSYSFKMLNNICELTVQTDTAVYRLNFSGSKWQMGETRKNGPSLVSAAKASYVGLPSLKIAGAFQWIDEQTLELSLRYIESPHTEKITCIFSGDQLSAVIENSFAFGKMKTTLTGVSK
ncbi:MAG: serine hydrolase [Ferruginibacter sp.]